MSACRVIVKQLVCIMWWSDFSINILRDAGECIFLRALNRTEESLCVLSTMQICQYIKIRQQFCTLWSKTLWKCSANNYARLHFSHTIELSSTKAFLGFLLWTPAICRYASPSNNLVYSQIVTFVLFNDCKKNLFDTLVTFLGCRSRPLFSTKHNLLLR